MNDLTQSRRLPIVLLDLLEYFPSVRAGFKTGQPQQPAVRPGTASARSFRV